MIAVEEALALVLDNSFPLKESEILPINQCINRNLAKKYMKTLLIIKIVLLPSYMNKTLCSLMAHFP